MSVRSSVRLSVYMSRKLNSSLMDELILFELYTVAGNDLRMCKKYDPGWKDFKGDNQ